MSLGVLLISKGVFGCLDSISCCLWVSGLCLLVSVGVWMVSVGVCGSLDGVLLCFRCLDGF